MTTEVSGREMDNRRCGFELLVTSIVDVAQVEVN
jgi:hypothetical protein